MFIQDVEQIPDLRFEVSPVASHRGAATVRCDNEETGYGARCEWPSDRFTENVFYRFADQKIAKVWSVITKHAIEAQVSPAA
jgi:predicted ester cyclase